MQRAIELNDKLSGFVPGEGIDPDDQYPGSDAPVAITLGDPQRALKPHVKGMHQRFWLLVAPNSCGMDPKLVEQLGGNTYSLGSGEIRPIVDGFLAPSLFAKDVLQREFPEHPVVLWRHGVLPIFRVNTNERESVREDFDQNQFRLLHITSTSKGRKGTLELLRAWKRFLSTFKTVKARLDVLVNPTHISDMLDLVRKEKAAGVLVVSGQNFEARRYVEGLSKYHAVVQPSRAEGFGLVPLEARACGIPVAMTGCTGHADHIKGPGVVEVASGEVESSDDFSQATSPGVGDREVYSALVELYENWRILDVRSAEHAPTIQEEWSWENQATRALKEIEKNV